MAAINTTQTAFAGNEQITSAKLNNILLQSKMDAGAVTVDGTITVISGQIQVGTLKAANYPALGITAVAIADSTITPAKLSTGGPSWTESTSITGSGVTGTYTVNFTPARTGDGDTTFNIGSQTATSTNASISRKSGVDGAFEIVQTGAGAMTFTSATAGFKFGTAPMPNPSGIAPIYGARAWMFMKSEGSARTADGKTLAISNTSAGVCTVTYNSHGFKTGHQFWLQFSSLIVSKVYTVTVVNANSFTVQTTYLTATTVPTVSIALYRVLSSGNINSVSSNYGLETIPSYMIINLNDPMPDNKYAVMGLSSYYYPNLDDANTSPITYDPSPHQTTNSFRYINNNAARYVTCVVFG